MTKKNRDNRGPLQNRVRKLLAAFPCPQCGRQFDTSERLRIPAHPGTDDQSCAGSRRPIGFFDDGLAAIPLNLTQEPESRNATRRMRKFLRELPPSERVSTSVIGNRAGRDWDVSSGLPSHGKGGRR